MTVQDRANLTGEQLREKYRIERDKRLRPDGPDQYLEPTGRFAHLLDDPWTERVEREPVTDEVTVAVIGAGFAGLCTGARLSEVGVHDVRLIDGAGDVGGVWYWNRYPGAMCDTAAMIYLPLLEETGHMPTMKYVEGAEIFEHAQRIATTFGLYDKALLSTEVTDLRWDDETDRWSIETNRGDRFRAKFVAMGTGPLSRPKLPGLAGIEDFTGHMFHTARWDYAYTGGDRSGAPMTALANKRVGIIGTGATSVQCVPHLSAASGELFVFQRTPSSVDARGNRPIDPDEFAALEPGWQRRWLSNFATLLSGGLADEDLVADGWTDISNRIRNHVMEAMADNGGEFDEDMLAKATIASDDAKMNEIRARVDDIVEDPTTAEGLKAWYRQLCKRPCFHDEYLQAFNSPTTHLINTDGKGVERIDETGVWANGTHYPLECIILASGFEVHGSHVADYETAGRNGVTLSEHWGGGMRSLHGIQMHGFPNLFVSGLSQGASFAPNVTQNHDETSRTIAAVVAHAVGSGHDVVEPTKQAEDSWVDLVAGSVRSGVGGPDCTPGYYNNEGAEPGPETRLNAASYPHGPVAYWEFMERWRESSDFDGLEFRAGEHER